MSVKESDQTYTDGRFQRDGKDLEDKAVQVPACIIKHVYTFACDLLPVLFVSGDFRAMAVYGPFHL